MVKRTKLTLNMPVYPNLLLKVGIAIKKKKRKVVLHVRTIKVLNILKLSKYVYLGIPYHLLSKTAYESDGTGQNNLVPLKEITLYINQASIIYFDLKLVVDINYEGIQLKSTIIIIYNNIIYILPLIVYFITLVIFILTNLFKFLIQYNFKTNNYIVIYIFLL